MYNNLKPNRATAYIRGGKDAPHLLGKVEFLQKRNGVLVTADISGLPKNKTGFYGFHVHRGRSCAGRDFSESGEHYNPGMRPYPLHAGVMPPLLSYGNGNAYLSIMTDRFTVKDIIGRTVVIHNGVDDFISQPSGNAGKKIACGEIRRG